MRIPLVNLLWCQLTTERKRHLSKDPSHHLLPHYLLHPQRNPLLKPGESLKMGLGIGSLGMKAIARAAGAVASQVEARQMEWGWRLVRGRCDRHGQRRREQPRRSMSAATMSKYPGQGCWTVVVVEKGGGSGREIRYCSRAASTDVDPTEEQKNPKPTAGISRTLRKKTYRCRKHSKTGREGEGEGRSSRRRDHLIERSKDRVCSVRMKRPAQRDVN
jgi:hypothetical protein